MSLRAPHSGSERVASRISLDGEWDLWADLRGSLPTGPGSPFVPRAERDRALGAPRRARVPSPWQAQFEDLRHWAGTAWYERDVVVPGPSVGERVRLGFGAVDYFATVWVNGRFAGEHEGGYTPFRLDVTDIIRPEAANTVTVRALDVGPGDEDTPFPFAEIPHGKQSWYGPIGGIWQSAWLERRGSTFVDHVAIVADRDRGELSAAITLGGDASPESRIAWRVIDSTGASVAAGTLDPGETTVRARVAEALAWTPDTPHLYELELDVVLGENRVDHSGDRFGFRTIGVRDGRIALNGEPVYILGALDQDYWIRDIYTPGTQAEIDAQMRLAKKLGLNLLRCHVKPPDPRYLDAADRIGVLVWSEPPSWMRSTEESRRRARETFEAIVRRDINHPSLIVRSIVNEDWGTDLLGDPADRAWLRDTVRWARSLDPTRLVVDNSACPPNFHVESDVNDHHLYRSVPEQTASWRAWTSAWVSDPSSTYTPFGDGERRGSEPLIVSEFGIWGLPDPSKLLDDDGREPWWFVTGRDHSDGVVMPSGVRDRFDAWGLAGVFGSFERFVEASQRHEVDGLKVQIEDLRSHSEIAGYVITEFTDVHWEANGLLDMRRGPKADVGRLARANRANVVIVRPERTTYRPGERVSAEVITAAPHGLVDGAVEWRWGAFGLGGRTRSGTRLELDVPAVERPMKTSLETLWLADGRVVAGSDAPIWVFPATSTEPSGEVAIATRWRDVEPHLSNGGRAVLVALDEDALPQAPRVRLEPFGREDDASGSIYGNGWMLAAGMGWLSPALADGLAIGPAVDLAFDGLPPRFVVDGYGPADRNDVLAGHYLGWLHRMRALVAGFAHGSGAGVLCTLPVLGDASGALGQALLERMRTIAGAPAFAPRTRLLPVGPGTVTPV